MLRIIKSFLKRLSFFWFVFIASFLVFYYLGSTLLDPDFGWHIRLGQLITKSGIPRTDPFSYTMPSYPYVDHEWLTNVLFFLLYQTIHLRGMAIVFSILGLLSVFILIKPKTRRYAVVPVILTFAALLPRFSIRPQVVSWLFWAFVISAISEKLTWQKWRWFLPLLILIWVNIHGSFALGLGVILVSFLFYKKKKTFDWKNSLVAIASIVVTFINPYGVRIWWEVWMTATDTSLHSSVNEWAPFWTRPELSFAMMATIVLFFAWRYRKSISILKKVILIITLYLGMSAFRHLPFFMLACIPQAGELLGKVFGKIKKIPFAKVRFWKFYQILTGISLLLLTIEIVFSVKTAQKLKEDSFYPKKAVTFLKTHKVHGNVFSSYSWGGYSIWKNPSSKVFIDGRMPSFRFVAPSGQSNNALAEYIQVLYGKNRDEIFANYNITAVLWPSRKEQRSIWERLAAYLFSSSDLKEQSIVDYLTEFGWRQIYKDPIAVIYTRP